MKKRCVIISGGDFCPLEDLDGEDFVIACDRGCDYARRCEIVPDLAMGDFDSYSGAELNCPTERFRAEKDDTDTMLGIKKALELGYKELAIRCALGGRLDHLVANIQSLSYIAENGAEGNITDSNTYLRVFRPGKYRIPRMEGFSFSVFSLSNECSGLTLKGLKYPLSNGYLSSSFPLGVSNQWTEEAAELSFNSGTLLLICSRL